MAGAARRALERLESSTEELARLEDEAEAAVAAARECAARLTPRARRRPSRSPARSRPSWPTSAWLRPSSRSGSSRPTSARAGADRVVLELAANPRLPAGPVAETASGGELSRIALAIRVAARAGGGPGILLLDEVDAGIGGRTARAVADKLAAVADGAQLLVITHLPQIAGVADAHFVVEKPDDPGAATVVRLGEAEVVEELARMLGGDPDDEAARRHAEALRS